MRWYLAGQCTLLVAISLCILLRPSGVWAQAPGDDTSPVSKWESFIQAFEESDKVDAPRPNGILFVGSSSIHLWDVQQQFPDRQVINRGFGGSQMSDVLQHMHRIVLPYRPRLVVLYEGDNDIAAGEDPSQVSEEFVSIARRLHQELPDTRLIYLSIKPSVARRKLFPKMQKVNTAIKQYCEQHAEQCVFIDVGQAMLDEDGNLDEGVFADDGLHLNAEGYRRWSALVRPYFDSKR